jgi:hypothetical protein
MSAEYLIEDDGMSAHEFPGVSPTYSFSDNLLTVVPVKLSSTDESDLGCYSFICIPKQAKGKFLPKKAVELGCNPRIHFKILAEGNSVTLEDGSIVHPFQVLEDQLPSQAFVLMFLPSEEHMESLFHESKLAEFQRFLPPSTDA